MAQKNKKSKMTLDKLGQITQQGFLEVDKRFSEVNERFSGIDERFSEVDKKIKGVGLELGEVKQDVREVKENFSELFTKLDKFIALYEKQEQELLILGAQLRRLEERIAVLEKTRIK